MVAANHIFIVRSVEIAMGNKNRKKEQQVRAYKYAYKPVTPAETNNSYWSCSVDHENLFALENLLDTHI